MIQRLPLRLMLPIGLASLVVACGSPEPTTETGDSAAEPEASIIEVRQENFEGIADAFKAIRGQFEGDTPDFVVVETNASIINANAQLITGHFPEGTGIDSGAETEALEVIWETPEEFAEAAGNLVAASSALADAAAAQDLAAVQEGVGNLGGACKACHDVFRVEQE
ncbi:MAG: cytochrome c [Erythrobacter sp.]